MNIDICDNCGATSKDEAAQIQPLLLSARRQGVTENCFDGEIEMCAKCRDEVIRQLQKIVMPDHSLSINVNRIRGY